MLFLTGQAVLTLFSQASSQAFCCLAAEAGCQSHTGLGLCSEFVSYHMRTGLVVPGLTLQLSYSAPASQATEAGHPKPSACSLWTYVAVCMEKSTHVLQLRSSTAAMKHRPFKSRAFISCKGLLPVTTRLLFTPLFPSSPLHRGVIKL